MVSFCTVMKSILQIKRFMNLQWIEDTKNILSDSEILEHKQTNSNKVFIEFIFFFLCWKCKLRQNQQSFPIDTVGINYILSFEWDKKQVITKWWKNCWSFRKIKKCKTDERGGELTYMDLRLLTASQQLLGVRHLNFFVIHCFSSTLKTKHSVSK